MIIGKTFRFDAAHYLPLYKGKCKEMHGHTWHVTVEVEGEVQTEGEFTGMVLDLHDLSSAVNLVIGRYDHHLVNLLVEHPTCEMLAQVIVDKVQTYLPPNVNVRSVKVQEGEGGYALWQA